MRRKHTDEIPNCSVKAGPQSIIFLDVDNMFFILSVCPRVKVDVKDTGHLELLDCRLRFLRLYLMYTYAPVNTNNSSALHRK